MTSPSAKIHAASFRDPRGFVFHRDGVLYRQVNASFSDAFDTLEASGLYDDLVDARLLVRHEEVNRSLAAHPETAHRVLRPDPITFVSYPYEWCPAQLRAAALATLEIQERALDHGMSLRDASAFNIQFQSGSPVLIDSLSFEPLRTGEPWTAYAQFCSHFLAPLALQSRVDVRLGELQRRYIDGVPLDLASRLLPARTRLRPSLLTHLHLHGRMQHRYADRAEETARRTRGSFSERAFRGLVDSLRGAITKLEWQPGRTTWSDYYDEAGHYSVTDMQDKQRVVASFLDEVRPTTVWDLGANTGRFSRLAAERGADVIALDADPGAVEAAWRDDTRPPQVLPLVLDLTNPSPSLGWAHEERDSLIDRGPADLVFALALVHHLAVSGNVPFDRLAEFFSRCGRHLVIEFVPEDDPKVRRLMTNREDLFGWYRRDTFEKAFARRFDLLREEPLRDSGRILYLMEATDR